MLLLLGGTLRPDKGSLMKQNEGGWLVRKGMHKIKELGELVLECVPSEKLDFTRVQLVSLFR